MDGKKKAIFETAVVEHAKTLKALGEAHKFECRACPPGAVVRLQRVQYGHVENGEFVIDEETDLACCYCHTVYTDQDL